MYIFFYASLHFKSKSRSGWCTQLHLIPLMIKRLKNGRNCLVFYLIWKTGQKRNDTNGKKCITLEEERWNISVTLHLNNSPNSKQLIFIQIQNDKAFLFFWGHKQHEKQTVSRAESHIQADPALYPAGVERIPSSSGETSAARL